MYAFAKKNGLKSHPMRINGCKYFDSLHGLDFSKQVNKRKVGKILKQFKTKIENAELSPDVTRFLCAPRG